MIFFISEMGKCQVFLLSKICRESQIMKLHEKDDKFMRVDGFN
jgi:hypothetical protein